MNDHIYNMTYCVLDLNIKIYYRQIINLKPCIFEIRNIVVINKNLDSLC